MKKFYTYILFSNSLNKYYSGHSEDLTKRVNRHNAGKAPSTKSGVPWQLIKFFEMNSKSEAILLKAKIKKRGAKRFLQDMNEQ